LFVGLLGILHPLSFATELPYRKFREGSPAEMSPHQACYLRAPRTGMERRQLYTRPHLYAARTGGHPVNKILVTANHKVTTQHYRTLYNSELIKLCVEIAKVFNKTRNVHPYSLAIRRIFTTVVAGVKQQY
jgi:hypothetical protein